MDYRHLFLVMIVSQVLQNKFIESVTEYEPEVYIFGPSVLYAEC